MAMQAQLWTVNGIAVETGLTARAISRALRELTPAKVEGRRRYYWLRDALPLIYAGRVGVGEDGEATALDLATQKARQHKAMADKIEMENARTRGDLVSSEKYAALVEGLTIETRQRLMQIPARCADQLSRIKARGKAKTLLEAEIRDALASVSDDRLGLAPRL